MLSRAWYWRAEETCSVSLKRLISLKRALVDMSTIRSEKASRKKSTSFSEDGFEKMAEKVTGIEKELGIYELSQFTPKV